MDAFDELLRVVDKLRGENGCPWDRAQTFESLQKYIVAETQEVLEGVQLYEETGSGDNLCEELGDVLFEILLYSKIASEKGLFSIEDVIETIRHKMVGRHPRVFKDEYHFTEEEMNLSWDQLKKREKASRKSLKSGENKGKS